MHYACLSERAYALHSLHPSVPIKQLFSPRNKRTSSPVEAWRQHSQTSCPFEQLQNHETITSHVFDLLTNTCSQCAREFADVPMSTIMAFRIRKQPENLSPLFQQRQRLLDMDKINAPRRSQGDWLNQRSSWMQFANKAFFMQPIRNWPVAASFNKCLKWCLINQQRQSRAVQHRLEHSNATAAESELPTWRIPASVKWAIALTPTGKYFKLCSQQHHSTISRTPSPTFPNSINPLFLSTHPRQYYRLFANLLL